MRKISFIAYREDGSKNNCREFLAEECALVHYFLGWLKMLKPINPSRVRDHSFVVIKERLMSTARDNFIILPLLEALEKRTERGGQLVKVHI